MSGPTRDEILAAFPLQEILEGDGVKLVGTGVRRMALCMFHKEKTESFSVNLERDVFYCFGCQKGGSVIDYIALRDGKDPADVLRELSAKLDGQPRREPRTGELGLPTAQYVYQDALGAPAYRVLRFDPPGGKKTFKQQKVNPGGWANTMDGVERVLYRLPDVLAAGENSIWITEGEKDVETLVSAGFIATTNVGGGGNWKEGYTQWLAGKDVVICGDNDEVGRKHVKSIIDSLDGKAKRLRIVSVPDTLKDVSDFRVGFGSNEAFRTALGELLAKAVVLVAGASVPILSMAEMEDRYKSALVETSTRSYSFDPWLPTFAASLRPNVPGDVICFVAGTGVGKTALLQNMAWQAAPAPVLLFEMELADSVTFERFVASSIGITQDDVAFQYQGGYTPSWRERGNLDKIFVCPQSGLTVSRIEEIVNKAELKMGERPLLVMLDYVQLISGKGKDRYEQMTQVMSDVKSLAKNTGTVVVVASQIPRPRKGENVSPEVGLNDGKDSGQLENSSALHIGVWRDTQTPTRLWLRVNKNTRGSAGLKIPCMWDAARMRITEASRV
jgi:hypothetical protein